MLKTPISIPSRGHCPRTLKFAAFAATLVASLACVLPGAAHAVPASSSLQVQLPAGSIEGASLQVGDTELRAFKGIPYAAPPVGALRWKEPQPVAQWAGVRETKQFGPRCMQLEFGKTLRSRADSMSEDCLSLNVWTPARAQGEKLPVLVYFHGGAYATGDGSDPRWDGANLAARGIVTVTVNYRLGVFGFLALPELAQESPYGATGNYGLLDQTEALTWVRENIARFGGDPQQVTIAGDSAGSKMVAAHMASPLSRGLFARAIGKSGAALGSARGWNREVAEAHGQRFTTLIGETSLERLRARPAQRLLDTTAADANDKARLFWPTVDGHFLSRQPEEVFRTGEQARVPLLLGADFDQSRYSKALGITEFTPEKWRTTLRAFFGGRADEARAFYPGHDKDEVARSASVLAADVLSHHEIWRWMEFHRAAHLPTYFYLYTQPIPPKLGAQPGEEPPTGGLHAAGIESALGNLDVEPLFAWTTEDRDVSRIFSGYITQFVKTGNPNGPQLPDWQAAREHHGGVLRQVVGPMMFTEVAREGARHAFLESFPEAPL